MTGGSSGLGRCFAAALARAGHQVAVLDLVDGGEVREEIERDGGTCLIHVGDASDPVSVTEFVHQLRQSQLAPVRVLVNNVGISPYTSLDELELDEWRRVLTVNLDSVFLLTKAVLPDLKASGAGRVVNLTSTVVWDAQCQHMTAYVASKAGVVGATRAMAAELGQWGITVNAIAPGIVLTPDIQQRVSQQKLDIYLARQSIPQLAAPDDLVTALEFLVAEGSRFVTGTVVPVNGGRVFL